MGSIQETWPSNLLSLSKVRNWIALSLPQTSNVFGPTKIHQQTKWGMVAEFLIQKSDNTNQIISQEPVIFKANFNKTETDIGAVYKLLSQYCTERVPVFLASKNDEKEHWMLFEPFYGKRIRSYNTLDTSLSLAQALAKIQTTIAKVPERERGKVRYLNLENIPSYFDELVEDIKAKYLELWINPERNLMNQYKIPIHILDKLEGIKPRIKNWVNELLRENWPETINHMDLHGNNAIIKNNGEVLIYDWDEAMVGCPFFSLYRIMTDYRLQNQTHSTTSCFPTNMDPNEIAIMNAYINALPWKDIQKRKRAFEAGTYLSPVLYMHKDYRMMKQLGLNPVEMLAGSIGNAILLWESC